MKKKVWIWLFVIIAIIAIIGTIIFVMYPKTDNEFGDEFDEEGIIVQKASEQELGDSILVTGKIVPEDEQKVFLDSENGEIHEYLVEENQKVSVGDALFNYDATKVNVQYNQAVRDRDLIQKRVKIEESQITQMAKQIATMKKELKTTEEYTQEDINALEKEKVFAEMEIEATKSEVTSSQEMINELAEAKINMTAISKIDGVIVKVNKNIEVTETGSSEPVIHIISSEPYKVIGTMSEFDTVKIEPNQQVIIRPKVFKDREWNGVVESVSQFPDGEEGGMNDYESSGGSVTMYPFKVTMTDDTSELRQGFHVSMEIKLSGNDRIIAVPHMALMNDFDEETEESIEYIYVLQDELIEKRLIQTGEMNDEFIGITEGLAVDELVIINPHDGLFEGMEVVSFDEVE